MSCIFINGVPIHIASKTVATVDDTEITVDDTEITVDQT
jgi:hypothetical protein